MIDKEMMERARKIAAEYKDPSGIFAIPNVSYFQRKLQISYIRATEIHYALYGAKKQTNGDHLRAMSNKELAEILVYSEDDEWYGRQWFSFDGDHIRNAFPTKQDAIKSTIDWLNSPAESEVNHDRKTMG